MLDRPAWARRKGHLLYEYRPGLRDSTQSFSRSSTGVYRNKAQELVEAASGERRDYHWVKDENGDLVRATRLEAPRTNSILHSEDFTDAAWDGPIAVAGTVTADAVTAPDGTNSADTVTDDDSSAIEEIKQVLSVSDDSLDRVASIFVEKGANPVVEFRISYTGGTASEASIQFDPDSGNAEIWKSDAYVRHGVEDYNADWWRVWLVATNNGTGNTNIQFRFFPATGAAGASLPVFDNSVTGGTNVWGAQLEGVSGGASSPSSYIATSGSAVSRAADGLSDSISFGVQDLSAYVKYVAHGDAGVVGANPRALAIGDDGGSGSFLAQLLRGTPETGPIKLNVNDGDNNWINFAGIGSSPSYGDVVEAMLFIDGTTIGGRASINGGSVVSNASAITGVTLASEFDKNKLWVGRWGDGAAHISDFIAVTVAPGVQSMATMRSLAART